MKKTHALVSLLVTVLLFIPTLTLADQMNFNLDMFNVSGYSGPYATVTVNMTDTTHATITFSSLVQDGNIYLFGGAGAVGVNVNASTWTVGSFSSTKTGNDFTSAILSNGGSGNEDGWGVFNQRIDGFDGYTHAANSISFIVTNTADEWASAADVLIENALGHMAAAHLFVTSNPANASNGALITGFATDGGGSTPVPEPATLLLFGTGLVGLAGLARKKNA